MTTGQGFRVRWSSRILVKSWWSMEFGSYHPPYSDSRRSSKDSSFRLKSKSKSVRRTFGCETSSPPVKELNMTLANRMIANPLRSKAPCTLHSLTGHLLSGKCPTRKGVDLPLPRGSRLSIELAPIVPKASRLVLVHWPPRSPL